MKSHLLGELGELLADDAAGRHHHLLAARSPQLAAASGRPERFAGIHVFNPVEKMKLVELAFPDEASRTPRARASASCARRSSKTPVEVPDAAGFVVNRLLFPYLFNAVRLLERERHRRRGGGRVHEARRRPPDGAARAARLRRASTWRRRSASSIGAEVPARVRAADRRREARPEERRGLLRVCREAGELEDGFELDDDASRVDVEDGRPPPLDRGLLGDRRVPGPSVERAPSRGHARDRRVRAPTGSQAGYARWSRTAWRSAYLADVYVHRGLPAAPDSAWQLVREAVENEPAGERALAARTPTTRRASTRSCGFGLPSPLLDGAAEADRLGRVRGSGLRWRLVARRRRRRTRLELFSPDESPAARSQTTSASPIPCELASVADSLPVQLGVGQTRPSGRARAPRARRPRDGPTSPCASQRTQCVTLRIGELDRPHIYKTS